MYYQIQLDMHSRRNTDPSVNVSVHVHSLACDSCQVCTTCDTCSRCQPHMPQQIHSLPLCYQQPQPHNQQPTCTCPCQPIPAPCCPSGASMYVSLDWLPAEPQHANTGVMLFANTPQLPGLITTWQLAIDAAAAATWQQGDPDYLNHLLHSDDTFQGSVWLLPACHLNDRPKSLVDRTFIAQMGCTGATAATAEASDIAAEALMAAEKKEEDEEEALWRAEVQRLQLEGHALPAGMLQQVPRQELRGPRELRAVDMETYYGFWDTRYGEPEADNSGGGKGGGKEASSV